MRLFLSIIWFFYAYNCKPCPKEIHLMFQELKDCKSQMTDLTNQWYQAIRISPDQSDEETGTTARSSISSIVRWPSSKLSSEKLPLVATWINQHHQIYLEQNVYIYFIYYGLAELIISLSNNNFFLPSYKHRLILNSFITNKATNNNVIITKNILI